MELSQFFKSIIDMDKSPVVICNLQHEIIYMNPTAKERYKKHGNLTGKSLLACHGEKFAEMIKRTVEWFSESPDHNIIHTFYNEKQNRDVYMVALRDDMQNLIGYYEKHEYRTKDTAKFYDFT